ncbi:hypothetical protein Efla_003345 [Eimeria flavescens]
MALFTGCTSIVADDNTEFVVGGSGSGAPSRQSVGWKGCQGAPQGVPPGGAFASQLRSGSSLVEGPLDPQQIGRVLTVAVSELGEQVKSGGELLWRSALSAAGQALSTSPANRGGGPTELQGLGAPLLYSAAAGSKATAAAAAGTHAASTQNSWGEANFFLSVKEERINTDGTGRLVASAQASDENGSPSLDVTSDCSFTWTRKKPSGVSTAIKGVEGNVYIISGDDIGACVEVCAAPKTLGGLIGRRYASVGPFQVDLKTKTLIVSTLANGGTRFACTLAHTDGSALQRSAPEVFVDISFDKVVLTINGPEGLEDGEGPKEFTCLFTTSHPSVELDPTSACLFQLRFSDDLEFSLCASSRKQRDLLAITLRCFQIRLFVSTSVLLDRLTARLPCENGEDLRLAAQQADPRVDLYCTLHAMQSELQRSLAVSVRAARDFSRISREKEALEEEMRLTISAFQTQLATVAQQQQSHLSSSSSAELEETRCQLAAATAANEALQADLQKLRQLLQQKQAAGEQEEAQARDHVQWLLRQKANILAKEKETLEKRLAAALKAAEASRDAVHSKELISEIQRLRAEVEEAHLHKSRVSLQLQDAQRAFEEERKSFRAEAQQLRDELMHAEARAECLADQVGELRAAEAAAEEQFAQRTAALHATTAAAEKETAETKQQAEVFPADLERSKALSDQAAAAVRKLTQSNQQLQQENREQQRLQQQQQEQQQQLQQQQLRELQQQLRDTQRHKEETMARLHAAEGLVAGLRRDKSQLEAGLLLLQQQQQQLQQQLQQQQQQMQQQLQQLQQQQKLLQQQQLQLHEQKEQRQKRIAAAEAATRPTVTQPTTEETEETARLKAENESLKARLRKLGRPRVAPLAVGLEEATPREALGGALGPPYGSLGEATPALQKRVPEAAESGSNGAPHHHAGALLQGGGPEEGKKPLLQGGASPKRKEETLQEGRGFPPADAPEPLIKGAPREASPSDAFERTRLLLKSSKETEAGPSGGLSGGFAPGTPPLATQEFLNSDATSVPTTSFSLPLEDIELKQEVTAETEAGSSNTVHQELEEEQQQEEQQHAAPATAALHEPAAAIAG